MVFVLFLDGGMLATMFIMGLLVIVGALEQALPVITVILWIIFGAAVLFGGFMAFADDTTDSFFRKFINLLVHLAGCAIIGCVLHSYIEALNNAMNMGGINGFFEFILVGVFGAVELMLTSAVLGYTGMMPMDSESTMPYGLRLTCAIAAVGLGAWIWFG